MLSEQIQDKLVKLEVMKVRIEASLEALQKLLPKWEKKLKEMIMSDKHNTLIRVQEDSILKLKAKIDILNDINR